MTTLLHPQPYEKVVPFDHDPTCRRGEDPCSEHYGLDRENCERCRSLWQRLLDVAARRKERTA